VGDVVSSDARVQAAVTFWSTVSLIAMRCRPPGTRGVASPRPVFWQLVGTLETPPDLGDDLARRRNQTHGLPTELLWILRPAIQRAPCRGQQSTIGSGVGGSTPPGGRGYSWVGVETTVEGWPKRQLFASVRCLFLDSGAENAQLI
jgi:hypothetical protein